MHTPMEVIEAKLLEHYEAEEVPNSGSKGWELVATRTAPPLHDGRGEHIETQPHHCDVESTELQCLLVLLPVHLET